MEHSWYNGYGNEFHGDGVASDGNGVGMGLMYSTVSLFSSDFEWAILNTELFPSDLF